MPDNKPFLDPADILKRFLSFLKAQPKTLFNSKQGLKIVGIINKLAPLGKSVNESIDFNRFAEWFCELPFITNKPLMKTAILTAANEVEKLDDK